MPGCVLSERAGGECQVPIGRGSGGQGRSPLKSLHVRLQIARKAHFLVSKYILSLGITGYLLYDV